MPYKCSCGLVTDVGRSWSNHTKYYVGRPGHEAIGWVDPTTGEVLPKRPKKKYYVRKTSGTIGNKTTTTLAIPSDHQQPVSPPVLSLQISGETVSFTSDDILDLYQLFRCFRDIGYQGRISGFLKESVIMTARVFGIKPDLYRMIEEKMEVKIG